MRGIIIIALLVLTPFAVLSQNEPNPAVNCGVSGWVLCKGSAPLTVISIAPSSPLQAAGYSAKANKKNAEIPTDMVLIPAGEFWMGSDEKEIKTACAEEGRSCEADWFSQEMPKHKVYLDAYAIDKYLVTNAQYTKCVQAGQCKEPYKTEGYDDSAFANHPVVDVDWFMAEKYCKWAGKRLPTEAEWEKAARGKNGNTWPWGNKWDCKKSCNSFSPCEHVSTCEVGSYPEGASPYGVLDMAGNVWEWVSDWYDANYYKTSPKSNPKGPEQGTERVIRGGSVYEATVLNFRGASRSYSFSSSDWTDNMGFRCAEDAK